MSGACRPIVRRPGSGWPPVVRSPRSCLRSSFPLAESVFSRIFNLFLRGFGRLVQWKNTSFTQRLGLVDPYSPHVDPSGQSLVKTEAFHIFWRTQVDSIIPQFFSPVRRRLGGISHYGTEKLTPAMQTLVALLPRDASSFRQIRITANELVFPFFLFGR